MLYVSKLIEEKELTNSTDDGGPAEVFGRIVLGIELGQPLDSSAPSVQMVEGVRHAVSNWISRLLTAVLIWIGSVGLNGKL